MGHFPDFDEDGQLPDIYRSREAFFATLPAWRRFLAKLNWRPIIDLMVEQYHGEQSAARLEQALKEEPFIRPPSDELLAELDAEHNRRAGRTVASTAAPAPKP